MNIAELINKVRNVAGKRIGSTDAPNQKDYGPVAVKSWYAERYDNLLIQRNILLGLMVGFLFLAIVAVLGVVYVLNAQEFDPFVIQIDDVTGMAKVVDPSSSQQLEANDALAQYFIKQYITSRETYNPVDYNDIARKKVRLFSSPDVFWHYRGYMRNPAIDPVTKYGQKNTTFLVLKSWSKLGSNKYIVRFSVNETAGDMKIFHKIAVVEYKYIAMELTEQERDINPVGFQVTNYRVDDDSS